VSRLSIPLPASREDVALDDDLILHAPVESVVIHRLDRSHSGNGCTSFGDNDSLRSELVQDLEAFCFELGRADSVVLEFHNVRIAYDRSNDQSS